MVAALLDEGLPLRAASWLRDRGVDAAHARELGLTSATDGEILEASLAGRRTCFTLDQDFHAILAWTGALQPSVVLIRIQQTGYLDAAKLILHLIQDFHSQLAAGVALTATQRGVRLRSLPLK